MADGNGGPDQTETPMTPESSHGITRRGFLKGLLGLVGLGVAGTSAVVAVNKNNEGTENQIQEAQDQIHSQAAARQAAEPVEQVITNPNLPQNKETMTAYENSPTRVPTSTEKIPKPTVSNPAMWEKSASTPEPGSTPSTLDQRVNNFIQQSSDKSK